MGNEDLHSLGKLPDLTNVYKSSPFIIILILSFIVIIISIINIVSIVIMIIAFYW